LFPFHFSFLFIFLRLFFNGGQSVWVRRKLW
jgi:hypothetical protein